MTLHLWLTNLGAYSAQIAAIVVVGAALPYLLRVQRPDVMLFYRQTLLAACLLLPLLQPWKRPVIETSAGVSISTSTIVLATPGPRPIPVEEIGAFVLCAGILARLCWIGIGLRRLRRYRRRAERLSPLPAIFEDLQLGLNVRPLIGVSKNISSPVAFGVRNPVILLPVQFLEMPESAQQAIACHEMAHIRRGDWAFTMMEEVIRAVFWFHPCIWWLLGQIQLTREQAVDAEVIAGPASREQYVDALLAVAGARLEPDLAPASLFLRKSHLSQRVSLIMRGVSMSRPRLFTSLAAISGALVVTARVAVLCFPISAPAQEVVRGEANLLHRAPLTYPADAIEKGIQGTVLVEATLNERGVVTDARVVSGPEILRKAALKSVLEWHYSGQATSPVQVAIDFVLPVRPPAIESVRGGVPGGVPGGVIGGPNGGVIRGVPGPVAAPAAVESGRLTRIQFAQVSPQLREALGSRLPVREGDYIQPDTLSRIKQIVKELDEHLDVRLGRLATSEGGQDVALQVYSTAAMETPAPATTAQGVPQRIRVGGNVQSAMGLSTPPPAYPPMAKQARISGVVRLAVIIGKDGTMQDIKAEAGHPLLVPAALDAVRYWTYKPTLLNGQPVEVVTVVDVNFTLSQ